MFPAAFEHANQVFDAPPGMEADCEPINACICKTSDGLPCIVTCWKPTEQELEEINRTKRVWVFIYSNGLPPHAVGGIDPFRESGYKTNEQDL